MNGLVAITCGFWMDVARLGCNKFRETESDLGIYIAQKLQCRS